MSARQHPAFRRTINTDSDEPPSPPRREGGPSKPTQSAIKKKPKTGLHKTTKGKEKATEKEKPKEKAKAKATPRPRPRRRKQANPKRRQPSGAGMLNGAEYAQH